MLSYLPQKPFLPAGIAVRRLFREFGVDEQVVLQYFPELEPELKYTVGELSGGMQRLLSALLIVLSDARFSLLDEPFSHIMPVHVATLKKVIVAQKSRKGFIITDHMYRHVLEIKDQVYLLKEGKSILIKDLNNLAVHGYLRHLDEAV